MLDRIDHIGIACHDLAAKIAFYQEVFDLTVVSQEINEEQGVREAMLRVSAAPGGASWIQLLEPLGPDTPVGRFLARRGEGVHHIGYGVTSITEALAAIGARGIRLLDARPRHGSMGAAIAFLHPADVGGVLTELVQAAGGSEMPAWSRLSAATQDLAPGSRKRPQSPVREEYAAWHWARALGNRRVGWLNPGPCDPGSTGRCPRLVRTPHATPRPARIKPRCSLKLTPS